MEKIKKVLLAHGFNGIPEIFKTFKSELEAMGCEVLMPDFPVREEISVEAYFDVFNRCKEFIGSDCAVIAHSIGNGMLLKYLAANKLSLGRYISLAGFTEPFVVDGKDVLNEKVALINLSTEELDWAKNEIREKFCIFSNNDHIVPYLTLQDYARKIDGDPILIEGIGHMGHKAGITEIPGVAGLASGNIEIERCCGCIIMNDNKVLFEKEISRRGDNFWAFPKGHVEGDETDIEAALRETKEEVGLDVEITDNKPVLNCYFLNDGAVYKRVLLFLAKPVGELPEKIITQEEEVEEVRWLSLDEARELADFEATKLAIDEAKLRLGL